MGVHRGSFLSGRRDVPAEATEPLPPWCPVVVTSVNYADNGGVISVNVERAGETELTGVPIVAFTGIGGIRGVVSASAKYIGTVTFDLPTVSRVADDLDFDEPLVVRSTEYGEVGTAPGDAYDSMLVNTGDDNALLDSPEFLATGYLDEDADQKLAAVFLLGGGSACHYFWEFEVSGSTKPTSGSHVFSVTIDTVTANLTYNYNQNKADFASHILSQFSNLASADIDVQGGPAPTIAIRVEWKNRALQPDWPPVEGALTMNNSAYVRVHDINPRGS